MAIVGIGIDIIFISRIETCLQRYGERFRRRIFHPLEETIARTRSKEVEYLAGCFCVKEAALKALGDFPGRGIPWNEIYISHERTGKPILHFEGRAKALCDEKGVRAAHVSITHDGDIAQAQVVLEE